MNLKQIEQTLTQKRAELAGRADRLQQDITRQSSPLEEDWEEASIQRENDQVLDALDDETRAELQQIDRALGRIREGRYGQCEKCSGPIAAERLEALPYATTCVKCA